MREQRCAWCWRKLTRRHECEGMREAVEAAMKHQAEAISALAGSREQAAPISDSSESSRLSE